MTATSVSPFRRRILRARARAHCRTRLGIGARASYQLFPRAAACLGPRPDRPFRPCPALTEPRGAAIARRVTSEPRALIVTPTYNERANLETFVAEVRAAAPHADMLIVDDASPDGTGELADEI